MTAAGSGESDENVRGGHDRTAATGGRDERAAAGHDGGTAAADGAASAPPACYRHPDRETYVRCSRCDRPICPDCMVSASVGFQCPDCVREGNRTVRQARTAFGGRVHGDTALVTKGLIAINLAVFLLALVVGAPLARQLVLIAVDPYDGEGVAQGGWYRLLTSAFLHQQVLHLALNMFALWIFGPPLEASLGRARFLALYLLSAVAGSAASYAFNPPLQGSLGASGAIFGVVGAALVADRRTRSNRTGLLVYLAVLLLPGFLIPGIDWRAHVGGLIAGALLALVFAYAPRARRTVFQAAAAGAVLAAVVAVVALRTYQLGF
jgi:membrane associated rhomboid family serine protease